MFVLAAIVRAMPPAPPQNGPDEPPSVAGAVAVVAVMIYSIAFTVSLGPLSWNICAEVRGRSP